LNRQVRAGLATGLRYLGNWGEIQLGKLISRREIKGLMNAE
jgi:hypothetical protein